jgi:hypothetical protein
MNAMQLSQQPHLIYSMDEIGLQVTYFSGDQKMLAINDSERVHSASHGDKAETVRAVDCMNASARNWILPVVLRTGE